MVKRKYSIKNKNKNINNNKISINIHTHKKSSRKRKAPTKKHDEPYRPTTIINNIPTPQPNYDMIHNFRNDIQDMKVKLNSFENKSIPIPNTLTSNIPNTPSSSPIATSSSPTNVNVMTNPEEEISKTRTYFDEPESDDEDVQDNEHKRDGLHKLFSNAMINKHKKEMERNKELIRTNKFKKKQKEYYTKKKVNINKNLKILLKPRKL